MRKILSYWVLLVGIMASGALCSFAAEIAESDAPEWLEQKQDAASFASDWLTDLDNGQYASAAASYTVDGNRAELEKSLQSMRSGVGELSSRSYGRADVFAVATDDSEHKVRVVYFTEFSQKTVTETVDVLLWHTSPIVLAYTIEEK